MNKTNCTVKNPFSLIGVQIILNEIVHCNMLIERVKSKYK